MRTLVQEVLARHREKEPVMTWSEKVEWTIPAISFIGMSAIPVVINLAVMGWHLSHVSWAAWGLSAWLLIMAVGGIREAIADRDQPSHERDGHDHTRL
jgi:hypothetical protein